MSPRTLLTQAGWIWLNQRKVATNQYACFRKAFTLKRVPRRAVVDVSVESDFILSVNGVQAAWGQYADWPRRKTYTRVDVAKLLAKGRNVICVFAHYRGEDFRQRPLGRPGLILAMKAGERAILTDGTWRAWRHPAYRSGRVPRVTSQLLTFTVQYDARREVPWQKKAFSDSGLPLAMVVSGATDGFWREILPRPVPMMCMGPETPARLVGQGLFVRTTNEGSFADIMSSDALIHAPAGEVFTSSAKLPDRFHLSDRRWLKAQPPKKGTTGCFVILDLGREEVGALTLRLDAPAGTVLDIAHGEHLDEGRVRMKIGMRNFADRYICREGRNAFTIPFRRFGLRYLQVHISCFRRPLRLDYIGVRPTELSVPAVGHFETHDTLANRTYQIGTRTMHLCMHQHYEDCPWREQGLYAFDARNQALFGYYAFGNYDFAAASLDLLGRGVRDDGQLELHAMGSMGISSIPSFTLVWVTAVAEHWLYSGTGGLYERFAKQIDFMLGQVFDRLDPESGLYHLPPGSQMWHFYEWTFGLRGEPGHGATGRRHDAPYNLFLLETLSHYAWMLDRSNRPADAEEVRKRSDRLAKAVNRAFWDEKTGAYATYLLDGKRWFFSDFVQILAMHEGIVATRRAGRVLGNLRAGHFAGMTLSSMVYLVRALVRHDEGSRRFVRAVLAKNWDPMVFAGATSFWETALGADDFDKAASLCHAWSSLPVYYYQACVLGVHPLAPGFREFLIRPYPDRFFAVDGSIPTPHGPVEISWTRRPNGLLLTASGPANLRPLVNALPEAPILRATYNGRRLRPTAGCDETVRT